MKTLSAFLLLFFFHFSLWAGEGVEKVRLLMIGNSFSRNAATYLPEIAKAAGRELILEHAMLGGCSLERHAKGVEACEADPAGKKGCIYTRSLLIRKDKESKSLRELLQMEPWDYVSIQQVSKLSFDESSYEPHARTLVEAIRKYAPTAKILVHQTWEYRADHTMFAQLSMTPEAMYTGLSAAYAKLAQNYNATILPVGLAFHAARQRARWKQHQPDAAFDYAHPTVGQVPVETGGLYRGWGWAKNKGKQVFTLDAKHANAEGCYLGGCVIFEVLFRQSVVGNTFAPKGITPGHTRQLQEIAHASVTQFQANPAVLLTGEVVLPAE